MSRRRSARQAVDLLGSGGVTVRCLFTDYMHAQLCNAALHAFAAENEARMEAMASARNQIESRLSALQATQRQVRQEEIIELAAGETASRSDHN